jgi:hypothetical protein
LADPIQKRFALKKVLSSGTFSEANVLFRSEPDGEGMVLDESFDKAGDGGLVGDCLPKSEQRQQLRRDLLLYARLFPPGTERNELRRVARSLAFFDQQPEAAFGMLRQQTNTGGPQP